MASQDASAGPASKRVSSGICYSLRELTARRQASTACRRRTKGAEVHELRVDRENVVRIVERLVEPTHTMATRKSLTVGSLAQTLQGKHGIVVTALR